MRKKLKPICYHKSKQTLIAQINEKESEYKKIITITDENIYARHKSFFEALHTTKIITIPAGEKSKNITTIMSICEQMAASGAGRNTLTIGIGGGVVTDISGFVANIYQRGIDLNLIPTSLLSMVDASIGGKNGIDAPWGKNQIGTIYMPKETFLCAEFLDELPEVEIRNGMAEMIKHGIIGSPKHFEDLHSILEAQVTWKSIAPYIRDSAEIKMHIVRNDLNEKTGARIQLNLGHTFAHAIEQKSEFKIPHGTAVAMGTIMATDMGLALGITKPADAEKIKNTMWKLFPIECPYTADQLWPLMKTDKKRSGDEIHFIIPKKIGKVTIQPINIKNPPKFFQK